MISCIGSCLPSFGFRLSLDLSFPAVLLDKNSEYWAGWNAFMWVINPKKQSAYYSINLTLNKED